MAFRPPPGILTTLVVAGLATLGSLLVLGNIESRGQIKAADGSAGAPGFTFASDTNTGLYRVGTDEVGISAGGVLRMSVDTSQAKTSVDIVPTSTDAVDLGSPALSFKDMYGSGTYHGVNMSLSGGMTFERATGTSATTTNLFATHGEVTNFIATNLTATNASGSSMALTGNFNAGSSTVTTLDFTNATGGSIYADTARFGNLTISETNIDATGVTWTSATGSYLNIAAITSNLVPIGNALFNLGSPTYSWQDIYASGTIYGVNANLATLTVTGTSTQGQIEFTQDAGQMTAMDMEVVSASAGEQMSYTFKIDGTSFLKMYAQADGSGGLLGPEIRAFQDFLPSLNNLFSMGTSSRSWKDIYASGTAYIANGVFETVKIGSGGSTIDFFKKATSTLDSDPLTGWSATSVDIAFTGALSDDLCYVTPPFTASGTSVSVTCIPSADTLTFWFKSNTSTTMNPESGTFAYGIISDNF